jgi:hypothetical protein
MRYTILLGGALLGLLLPPGVGAQEASQPTGQRSVGSIDPTDQNPQFPVTPGTAFSVGGFVGYQDGLSFQAIGIAHNFARGVPFQARLRLARTSVEPGSAPDARRIFINNATNGTPKEKGSTWDFGLDALYPTGARSNFFAGVRHTRFKANFKYVGGNEDFDVTSSHWGLAAGMEAAYPVGAKMALVISGGAEYFFSSRLTGHDTSYSPDGDNVNPREDYTYSDADAAVDQPKLRPLVLLGFTYRLGR